MTFLLRALYVALALCAGMTAPASAVSTSPIDNYTYMFCMTFKDLQDPPAWNTKRNFLEPMQKAATEVGATVEDIIFNPACEPRYIGATLSPLIHLVAENATDRLAFLVEIKKYFVEGRKRPDLWRAMVNSKNTRGMTVLDYMEYVVAKKKAIAIEAEGISSLIDFLCAEGGRYAVLNKSCPKAPEDSAEGIAARLQNYNKARSDAVDALILRQPDTRKPEDL